MPLYYPTGIPTALHVILFSRLHYLCLLPIYCTYCIWGIFLQSRMRRHQKFVLDQLIKSEMFLRDKLKCVLSRIFSLRDACLLSLHLAWPPLPVPCHRPPIRCARHSTPSRITMCYTLPSFKTLFIVSFSMIWRIYYHIDMNLC